MTPEEITYIQTEMTSYMMAVVNANHAGRLSEKQAHKYLDKLDEWETELSRKERDDIHVSQMKAETPAQGRYYAGICRGVVKTLDILGIKIKGVND